MSMCLRRKFSFPKQTHPFCTGQTCAMHLLRNGAALVIHRFLFLRIVFWLALVIGIGAIGAASAQNLPNHADPSAREEAPDLSAVPAIRFITSTRFPPFNYQDENGLLAGFHVDLSAAICEVLAVSCTLQAWPWDQAADALADNQGDALIAGLSIDEENAARFDFSDIYLQLPGRFVTSVVAANGFDVATLSGRQVAVREGSAHETFMQRYLPNVELKTFETEIAALEAVKSGTIEAYFGDALRASFWLNDNLQCCSFAGDPYFNPKLFGEGFAIAVPAGRGPVRKAINFALSKLKRNGKLDELYLQWFPVSFY